MKHPLKLQPEWWQKLAPITLWLPAYKRGGLKKDLLAGITLASFVLPGSMAYAGLAGLPPQAGIYCYIFGGLAFAIFTTSRHVAIGPISSISLLVGTTLATLSAGDTAKWITLAALTALGVGLIALFAYLVKLSSLVNFISETILLGFKAGAALSIASTVLPELMGIAAGGSNFFERVTAVVKVAGETNPGVLAFGSIIFILLLAGEKWLPGKPVSLAIVILSILLMAFTGLPGLGIKTIGIIPAGLPAFRVPLPGTHEMSTIIDLAFACFVLGYIETVSAARSLAIEHKYEIDVRQELISMGMANISVSLFGGYPVAGGLSQSAVNEKAGTRSPLSLIICSVALVLLLLFFTGLLKSLPKVLLSAIVLNAVLGLFKYRELKRLYSLSRAEFMVAMVALAGVLIFGILKGVMIAALLSLAMVIQKASHPYIARLGRIGNTHRFTDIVRHPDNILIPGIVILRVESSILYFNAQYVRDQIMEAINAELPSAKLLILDLSSAPMVDVSGSKMLLTLSKTMKERGIEFRIAGALATVRDMLRKQGIENKVGHISRKVSINDIVTAFRESNHGN